MTFVVRFFMQTNLEQLSGLTCRKLWSFYATVAIYGDKIFLKQFQEQSTEQAHKNITLCSRVYENAFPSWWVLEGS